MKLENHFLNYRTNKISNYSVTTGFILIILLSIQIITGCLLFFFFKNSIGYNGFLIKTMYTMLNIKLTNNGYKIVYMHSILSGIIVFVSYLHIWKYLYYKPWTNGNVFKTITSSTSGLIIFVFLNIASFTGYLLPWTQMSFWAFKVLLGIIDSFPLINKFISNILLSNNELTLVGLQKILFIHFVTGVILIPLIIYHINQAHKNKSSNYFLLSINENNNYIKIYPYFIIKDIFIFFILVIGLTLILVVFKHKGIFFNYIHMKKLTPLSTPNHITPEWFFLPFYACLKIFTKKNTGLLILFMLLFILCIVVLDGNRITDIIQENIIKKFNSNVVVKKLKKIYEKKRV